MALLKQEYVEKTSRELETLLELWLKVREFLGIAMRNDPISKEQEADFLKVKSDGTKYHRILKKKLTDAETRIKRLDFPYDQMIEILRGSISIVHLRALPEADLKKIRTEWHRIQVGLCSVVGAYEFLGSDQINLRRAAKRAGGGGLFGKIAGVFKRRG